MLLFCVGRQRNEQRTITHAYTSTSVVADEVYLLNSQKLDEQQKND